MASYGDLKAQIASDLRRSNLPNEIAQAILDAIRDHDTERYYFNETAVYTFSTTAGVDEYPITAQPPIQEFVKIDKVRAQVGNTWYTLNQYSPDEIEELFSVATSGQPYDWAIHGNNLRLFPTPNAAYPIKILGHYRLTPLVADADTNNWTNEGKNLIRYSALKRLYAYPIRDSAQNQAAEGAELRECDYLRRETDRRARSGRMKAYY
jgi:hypothetical protein